MPMLTAPTAAAIASPVGNSTLDVHSLAAGVVRSLGAAGAVFMKNEQPVVLSATAASSHTLRVTTAQRTRTRAPFDY